MLQIRNVNKKYKTGNLVQMALNDVSLDLRDNEFVAILGPSGSGKTTLLNIIGGLDRYDSGDLIINGTSTKKYKDRDWDSYRNHTVGFVFQSYNLIPHQSILANVELALTISGVGRRERRKRAMDALKEVGLADQAHKKPGQMSGGQMQRVSIARALVNNPDIVLADEPTGALDSETSIQVMDLLKQVAKDRLVVMVTHNPELAERYANRIVRLTDGKIISDSNPVDTLPAVPVAFLNKNMGKASMSMLTALSLSLNNLLTKKARTILTALAGSIGIIGIALILSLSSGANDYIQSIEEDTMSEYPIQITSSGFDISSMMLGLSDDMQDDSDGDVKVTSIVTNMFSTINTNDLVSFKEYLDKDEDDLSSYSQAIEYTYDVTPQIYRLEDDGSTRQVNPDSSFSALGFGLSSSSSSMLSSMMNTNVFYQMPEEESLYKEQYEVKAGRWPESYNECVLVLSSGGGINDFLLYTLGLRDSMELDNMIQQFIDEEDIEKVDIQKSYSYDDFLGISFKLVNSCDYYAYDDTYDIWVDKTSNKKYMKKLVKNGEDITIVGVVEPDPSAVASALSIGINYPYSLTEHVVEEAQKSDIVKQQLENKKIDVFTGEKFTNTDDSNVDLSSLFSIDQDALSDAFGYDTSSLGDMSSLLGMDSLGISGDSIDLSDMIDFSDVQTDTSDTDSLNLSDIMDSLSIGVSQDAISDMMAAIVADYANYAAQNPQADYTKLSDAISSYMASDDVQTLLQNSIEDIIAQNGFTLSSDQMSSLGESLMEGYQSYVDEKGYTDSDKFDDYFIEYLQTNSAQSIVSNQLSSMFSGSNLNISQSDIESLSDSLMSGYSSYASKNNLPDPTNMSRYITDYISSDSATQIITYGIYSMMDMDSMESQIESALTTYMTQALGGSTDTDTINSLVSSLTDQIISQTTNSLQSSMTSASDDAISGMISSMADSMALDEDTIADMFGMDMDQDSLSELMTSLFSTEDASYDGNLKTLGYADFSSPMEIDIYPNDFDSKEDIINILDTYNARMQDAGEEEKVISYTDIVGSMMSSITDIINVISYMLIAFVSISLIVSSIMIGVITYISVLERKKEIGILRAIGASKGNISEVFNAETFIIGLVAGVLGIALSRLILIPGNAIIHRLAGTTSISAILPISSSLLLILLSVVLTLISGLIPSRQAAGSDPVTALRTE